MEDNAIIKALLSHKSIRKYKDEFPPYETITSIVRAGQQAPFASQLYSLLLSREKDRHPFKAPLLFTICVDLHKLELVMAKRDWEIVTNDLSLLLFGVQDAVLMAQNMVIASESLGLGTCFLGGTPYKAEEIAKEYKLPPKVFPLVQLTVGYPAENPIPRPRYPVEFVLFEKEYPEFTEETLNKAMAEMDRGYIAQDYYRAGDFKIPIEGNRTETYTYGSYGWTEHISRKWGQWLKSEEQILDQLAKCGFHIGKSSGTS